MRRAPVVVVAGAAAGVAFVALPLLALVVRAPWDRLGEILGSGQTREALWLSVLVSTCAAVLSLVIGFPLAWVLARAEFRGKVIVRALVVLPLVLPPVVAGIALLTAFGRNGLLGRALDMIGVRLPFSTAGAVVATAFVAFPLLVLSAEAGLRQLDPSLEAAAASLGASDAYALRRVVLPLLAPQLFAGLVLAWARALGEFGATLMFAGNLRGSTQTLPLAVFERAQSDPYGSLVVALLLVVISLAVLVALRGRFLR